MQHKAVTLYKIALMDSFVQKGFALDWLSYSSKTIGQHQHHTTRSDKFSMVVTLCLYLVTVRFVLRNYLEHPNLVLTIVEPQLEGTRGFHRPPGKAWRRGTSWISHPDSEIHLCPGTEQTCQAELKYSDKNNKCQVSHCPAFICTVNISLSLKCYAALSLCPPKMQPFQQREL